MRRAVAAATSVVAFVLFPFARPADAKVGTEQQGGIYFTRDSDWKINLSDLTSATKNSAYHAIDVTYATTDLDPNTTVGGCSTSNDLCVFDWDYGFTGWNGIADCVGGITGSHPTMACLRHSVRINLYDNDYVGHHPEVATARRTLCHEIGHTVGLWHVNSSLTCMQRYEDGTGVLADYATTISSTERSDLNAHYK